MNHAASRVPVETWEHIIALAAYDPSPFALLDQFPHIHSRRARKLLRLGQQAFRRQLSRLACVCRSWRNLTERLVDQFLEVETTDELHRLGIARSGHGCLRRRRLDIYSSSWNAKTSYDLVLHDFRTVISNCTGGLEILSLQRAGLRYPMMPDKFLLEISDLLSNLKALEYAAAPGTGVDGGKIGLLATAYRSLQCLNCDILVISDALFNILAPAFPQLRALRTFVHAPIGSPAGLCEWLANWEIPALTALSLTRGLTYEDWPWLCALLRKNGQTLESIQFSKFVHATSAPQEFVEYCPRLHTLAAPNPDYLQFDIPVHCRLDPTVPRPPIDKIVVLEEYDGESILAHNLRRLTHRIWQMLRDVDRAAGRVLQFGDVTERDILDASDATVEALWPLIITMSKHWCQVMDADGQEIKCYLLERGRPECFVVEEA